MIPVLFAIMIIVVVAKRRAIKKLMPFLGKTDSLFSTILNERRKLWVYVPKENHDRLYPVVFLTDAEWHFRKFRAMLRRAKREDGSSLFPGMIVIGIPNTDRARDLTPSHSTTDNFGKQERAFRSSGGGAKFIDFIEKELIPHVESKYPVAAGKRIFCGHSLGGLMAVNILLNYSHLFDGYVASDPSIWWNDQMLLKQAAEQLKTNSFEGRSLFIGIANTAPSGTHTGEGFLDTAAGSHMRSIFHIVRLAEQNTGNGLRFDYKYYENENHDSVTSKAAYDGMRYLLGL